MAQPSALSTRKAVRRAATDCGDMKKGRRSLRPPPSFSFVPVDQAAGAISVSSPLGRRGRRTRGLTGASASIAIAGGRTSSEILSSSPSVVIDRARLGRGRCGRAGARRSAPRDSRAGRGSGGRPARDARRVQVSRPARHARSGPNARCGRRGRSARHGRDARNGRRGRPARRRPRRDRWRRSARPDPRPRRSCNRRASGAAPRSARGSR